MLATGTASGKSLAYQLPALSRIRGSRRPAGQRGATVLYIAPTKALAQDQLTSLTSLGLDVRVTTHDGDSSRDQRDWSRDHAEYVLTNPDMLHRSLLPGHARWSRVPRLAGLRRGRRVSPLPRRLRRPRLPRAAAAAPGVRVVRRPSDVRARLGHRGRAGGRRPPAHRSRRPRRHRRRLPARPGVAGAVGAPVHPAHRRERRAGAPGRVLGDRRPADRPGAGGRAHPRLRPLAARVEHVASTAAGLLAEVDPSLPGRVAAYRGGYLPEERRAIEAALRRGRPARPRRDERARARHRRRRPGRRC